MAWIESNCDIREHPKFLDLVNYVNINEDTVLGKLHRFWHWIMKYAEDGDLRKFNDMQLSRAIGLDSSEGKVFIESMVKACWLDREPYFRVHDWWDYAGKYLQGKYKRNPEKWEKIKSMYKEDVRYNNGTTTVQQPLTNQQNQQNKHTTAFLTKEKFELLWNIYPRKLGKEKAFEKALKQLLDEDAFENAVSAVKNYAESVKSTPVEYIKHGSTFFNKDWMDWIKYKENISSYSQDESHKIDKLKDMSNLYDKNDETLEDENLGDEQNA